MLGNEKEVSLATTETSRRNPAGESPAGKDGLPAGSAACATSGSCRPGRVMSRRITKNHGSLSFMAGTINQMVLDLKGKGGPRKATFVIYEDVAETYSRFSVEGL